MKPNRMHLAMILFIFMVGSAAALEMQSPSNQTYFTNTIQLLVSSNETLDNLSYSIDNGPIILSCQNCSSINQELNLSLGNHSITAIGNFGNESISKNISFSIQENQSLLNFSISFLEPKNIEYNSTAIPLNIASSENLDNLSLKLDDQNFELACSNCSGYNTTINVSQGNHTLFAKGFIDGNENEISQMFSVKLQTAVQNATQNLSLTVLSPESKTYNNHTILLSFSTNLNATIIYNLDNQSFSACGQCTQFSSTVNLENGLHTLYVNATSENLTSDSTITFNVNQSNASNNGGNDNASNKTNASRFARGFEKLPKSVENGELTDSELALIIRTNRLNPGIINRLIKTGLLGNESINAILDTQFTPPGILRKLLKLFGIHEKTYSDLIYENYKLSTKNEHKLLTRDDVSEKYVKSLEEKIEKKTESKIKSEKDGKENDKAKPEKETGQKPKGDSDNGIENRGQSKKIFNVGKQNGKSKDKNDIDFDRENGNSGKNGKSNSKGKNK